MLLQEIDWNRLIVVYITELFVCCFFLFLAFNILKRDRSRLAYNLSSFYIIVSISFLIHIILIPLRLNPLVHILSLLMLFLLFFGPVFLISFLLLLKNSEISFTVRKQLIVILIHGVILGLFLIIGGFLLGGVKIGEETNWRQCYNLNFSILLAIFYTCSFVAPLIIISIQIYTRIKDNSLKKRWICFFIGFCGLAYAAYGLIAYSTFDSTVLRAIISILSLIVVPSGYLIYYGIGRHLGED